MAIGFVGKALSNVWGWTQKAVSLGLEKVESFTEAITGGLVVREETWSQAFDLAEQQKEIWGAIKDIPNTYAISSEFALQSEFDWRQKYVMTMKVTAKDLSTDEIIERWVTVENDQALTKEEWHNLADNTFSDESATSYLEIYDVSDYEYYIKA